INGKDFGIRTIPNSKTILDKIQCRHAGSRGRVPNQRRWNAEKQVQRLVALDAISIGQRFEHCHIGKTRRIANHNHTPTSEGWVWLYGPIIQVEFLRNRICEKAEILLQSHARAEADRPGWNLSALAPVAGGLLADHLIDTVGDD